MTRHDMNSIPFSYSVKVNNRFNELSLLDREPDELWTEIRDIITEEAKKQIPRVRTKKRPTWLSENTLRIAQQRRAAKTKNDKQRFKHLNAEFQRKARKDRQKQLNKECMVIEENNKKGKTRDLLKKVREIKSNFTPRNATIANKEGTQINDGKQIKNRWKEYTEALYKCDDIDTPIHSTNRDYYEIEPEILPSEVKWAMDTINKNKAPGIDGIPIELIQTLGEDSINTITTLCQQIWKKKQWPNDWKRSIFVPIPKKPNAKDCSNYRTIALIPHVSKIMLKIIQRRLQPYIERELPDVQAGFRKGRGTRDQIANSRWIMGKAREFQKEFFLCFIDYTKAFDCVNHAILWKVLQEVGIPMHLIELIKNLYTNKEATVKTEYGNTDWFNIEKGVRQ